MNIEKYNIRKDIITYLGEVIQFHYNQNDKGHGIEHAKYVIDRSLKFASQVEFVNFEMVYVIAAYHDVAHHINAKKHETIAAKMLCEDKKLRTFFYDAQIKIMSEAVEDHRSSMDGDPRSIYGKIVSSADRNIDVETTLKRCYLYNRKHYLGFNEKKIIEECRQFIIKKFGLNGYARGKIYFEDKDYEKYLNDITELALDKEMFYKVMCKTNGIVV